MPLATFDGDVAKIQKGLATHFKMHHSWLEVLIAACDVLEAIQPDATQ